MNFRKFSRTLYDDVISNYDSYLWSNVELKINLKDLWFMFVNLWVLSDSVVRKLVTSTNGSFRKYIFFKLCLISPLTSTVVPGPLSNNNSGWAVVTCLFNPFSVWWPLLHFEHLKTLPPFQTLLLSRCRFNFPLWSYLSPQIPQSNSPSSPESPKNMLKLGFDHATLRF